MCINIINMLEIRNGISLLIFVYIMSSLFIWHMKPKLMFKDNKVIKFGIGKGKTIFNFYIVNIFVAIIMFYLFEIVWLKKNNFL